MQGHNYSYTLPIFVFISAWKTYGMLLEIHGHANPFNKCWQAKIIPYFQSQFCVILMSLHLILQPKVIVTCWHWHCWHVTVLVIIHYSIRQSRIAGKQACCYSKSHLTSCNKLVFFFMPVLQRLLHITRATCDRGCQSAAYWFHFSPPCVCLIWTGMTISLMGSLTDVPGAGASTDRTPSPDSEELMCCKSTPCGSLKEKKHLSATNTPNEPNESSRTAEQSYCVVAICH